VKEESGELDLKWEDKTPLSRTTPYIFCPSPGREVTDSSQDAEIRNFFNHFDLQPIYRLIQLFRLLVSVDFFLGGWGVIESPSIGKQHLRAIN